MCDPDTWLSLCTSLTDLLFHIRKGLLRMCIYILAKLNLRQHVINS